MFCDQNIFQAERSFRLVLASRSPRRRRLLEDAGYRFDVLPADDDAEERFASSLSDLDPVEFVRALANFKADNVVQKLRTSLQTPSNSLDAERSKNDSATVFRNEFVDSVPTIVLACDSVAACRGIILGKPRDEADARQMLETLSGSTHFVHSGLCLRRLSDSRNLCVVETSRLKMNVLSDAQIDEYLASGLWRGKAGAFGYQDDLDWLVLEEGSESNVVGLPMERLRTELSRFLSASESESS